MTKDLFGNETNMPDIDINEQYIKDRDESYFYERVKRLKYLHKINPGGLVMAGQAELVFTYRELQFCFIDGHFLSTIVLGQAFVEKLLYIHYTELGLEKFSRTLDKLLKHARKNKIINNFIIDKIDAIRLIRNPITHFKDFDYIHSLDNRSFKNMTSPYVQIEKDAYTAIEIATFISITDLNRIL